MELSVRRNQRGDAGGEVHRDDGARNGLKGCIQPLLEDAVEFVSGFAWLLI